MLGILYYLSRETTTTKIHKKKLLFLINQLITYVNDFQPMNNMGFGRAGGRLILPPLLVFP